MTFTFDGWPWKQYDTFSILHQALCIVSKPSVDSNWRYSLETLNSGQNWRFFGQCDLEIWWMTLKNNRAPLLCYFKLCALFHNHQWNQTGVAVRKHLIRIKIGEILSLVTLKFDRWHWKTIWHLFYATSNYVHHFVAICEFKVELWSRNIRIGAKVALTSVTLTFDLDLLHGHHLCINSWKCHDDTMTWT